MPSIAFSQGELLIMEDRSSVVSHLVSDQSFTESVRLLAETDAAAVAAFLQERGLLPLADDSSLSAEALLGIALCLRFRRWELNNIRVHIDVGLPTSDEVFARVKTLLHGAKLKKFVRSNWGNAIRVYHNSFLWSAVDCDLAVDVAIVAEEDEQFLDTVVDFLFQMVR